MRGKLFWTEETVAKALEVVSRYPWSKRDDALAQVAKVLGRPVSFGSLDEACVRVKGARLLTFMRPEELPSDVEGTDFSRLVALAKKKASIERVCDELDVSPAKLRRLVEEARNAGFIVDLKPTALVLEVPRIDDTVRDVGVPPVVTGWNWLANISDVHFGSLYCLRAQVVDFVKYAYRKGVRNITMSGDLLDGIYNHGKFEVSHNGLEAQTDDMLTTLPRLEGLRYWGITGNHEQTFAAQVGLNVGNYIQSRARETHGRQDIRFFGGRSAYFKVGGAKVHLWHPGGGGSYAKSYKLQKKIESYMPGRKPDILFTGHFHQAAYLVERGIHAFLASSFQGGGSDFAKSLIGSGDIGGWILKWRMTEHGTIRDLVPHKRTYFERECIHEVGEEGVEEVAA